MLSDDAPPDGGVSSFPPRIRRPVTPAHVPLHLALLHRPLAPGDRVEVGPEVFAGCDPLLVADLVEGAGFEPGPGEGPVPRVLVRRRTLADTVGPGMRLLVCGLNPSLVAADAGYGYAGATNRFWAAAMAAGLVAHPRDPLSALASDGVGMTDLVKRASPGAAVLATGEYRAGAGRVERLVRRLRPGAVVFVGLAGWRAAVDPGAATGWQEEGFGGAPAYVMPSTSGRNAHARLADLVGHLRAAAGPPPPRSGTGGPVA